MTSLALKKSLHQAIDEIEDEIFLQAVYTIVSSKVEDAKEYELSDEQLHILEERRAKYLSGKGQSYSWDEVKERLKKKE